jgi:hypothetical protein
VVDVDLIALSQGRDPGLDPPAPGLSSSSVHTVAAIHAVQSEGDRSRALAAADPDVTWETTHVGTIASPATWSRSLTVCTSVESRPADAAAAAHSYRRAPDDLALAGRLCDPMIVQAGEHFLGEHLNS